MSHYYNARVAGSPHRPPDPYLNTTTSRDPASKASQVIMLTSSSRDLAMTYGLYAAATLLALLLVGCGDTTTDEQDPSSSGGGDVIMADGEGSSWNNKRLDDDLSVPDDELNVADGSCGGAVESEVFRLLNVDRAENGLEPLRCDPGLIVVARVHSEDMATRGFFAHINPDDEQPWDRLNRYGITIWNMVGENIARGNMTPTEVEQSWMDSPGHRANILQTDFTHVGVGVYRDGDDTLWTQLFARF